MNLKDVFAKWRTATPDLFNEDQTGEPYTVQYRYIAKGEAERLASLDKDGTDQEVEKHPAVKQWLGDAWDGLPVFVRYKILVLESHVGPIDNLYDESDGVAVTGICQFLHLLGVQHASRIMDELLLLIAGVLAEEKKSSR